MQKQFDGCDSKNNALQWQAHDTSDMHTEKWKLHAHMSPPEYDSTIAWIHDVFDHAILLCSLFTSVKFVGRKQDFQYQQG